MKHACPASFLSLFRSNVVLENKLYTNVLHSNVNIVEPAIGLSGHTFVADSNDYLFYFCIRHMAAGSSGTDKPRPSNVQIPLADQQTFAFCHFYPVSPAARVIWRRQGFNLPATFLKINWVTSSSFALVLHRVSPIVVAYSMSFSTRLCREYGKK